MQWGLEHCQFGPNRAIDVDEIQYGRRHRCLTLVYQIESNCVHLLGVGEERTLASALPGRSGRAGLARPEFTGLRASRVSGLPCVRLPGTGLPARKLCRLPRRDSFALARAALGISLPTITRTTKAGTATDFAPSPHFSPPLLFWSSFQGW